MEEWMHQMNKSVLVMFQLNYLILNFFLKNIHTFKKINILILKNSSFVLYFYNSLIINFQGKVTQLKQEQMQFCNQIISQNNERFLNDY